MFNNALEAETVLIIGVSLAAAACFVGICALMLKAYDFFSCMSSDSQVKTTFNPLYWSATRVPNLDSPPRLITILNLDN